MGRCFEGQQQDKVPEEEWREGEKDRDGVGLSDWGISHVRSSLNSIPSK